MRRLLTTTALAALIATPVLAQQPTAPAAAEEPGVRAEAPGGGDVAEEGAGSGGVTMYDRIVVVEREAIEPMLASQWIGQTVYSTTATRDPIVETDEGPEATGGGVATEPAPTPERSLAESVAERGVAAPMASARPELVVIGEVDDLILDEQGRVVSVVMGVGGLLGLGETLVSTPFGRFTVAFDEDGSWIETSITEEELEMAVEARDRLGDADRDGVAATEGERLRDRIEDTANAAAEEARDAGEALRRTVDDAAERVRRAADEIGADGSEFTAGSEAEPRPETAPAPRN